MKIITISGKARHGKDTFARMLKEKLTAENKQVYLYSYASPLKMIARDQFNFNGEKDEAGRSLLQYLGTDRVRGHNENAWINITKVIIAETLYDADYIIIPDCRFPNEVSEWGESLLMSIKVIRKGFESELTETQKAHASETAMNDFHFDLELTAENLGELEVYSTAVANYILNQEKKICQE